MNLLRLFLSLLLLFVSQIAFPSDTNLEPVTLQLKWLHQFQFAGYYAAKEKGFYEAEGLDVTLRQRTPEINVIDEVLSGRAEFGVGGVGLLSRYEQGEPVRALAAIYQHDALVLLSKANSGIVSPYELKGKNVMFDTSTGNDAVIRALLNFAGLSIKDLNSIPQNLAVDKLVSGEIDALSAYITDQPFLLQQQGVDINIINPHNYGIDFYGDILFTSEQRIQQNPSQVEAFRRASLKGWEYALDHPEEIIQLIKIKYGSASSIEQLRYEAREVRKLILPGYIKLGLIQPERLQAIARIYQQSYPDFSLTDRQLKAFIYQHPTQFNLTLEEKQWLDQHPVIKVGVDHDFAPYEWITEKGEYMGLAADYIRLLETKLGVRFEIIGDKSWTQILHLAATGQLDMLACLNASPDREQYLQFTNPFVSNPIVIVNADRNGYVGSLDTLHGKTIAIEDGYYTAEMIARKHPEIKLLLTETTEQALQKVATGEADAYVGDAAYANFAIKKADLLNLQFAGQTSMNSSYRMGVTKSNPELLSIINKVLDQLSEEEHKEIKQQWLGLKVSTGLSKQSIVKAGLIIFLVMIWFAWWIHRLRKSKKQLMASEARLQNIIDASPIPHMLNDSKGTVTYLNQAFINTFGYTLSDIPTLSDWWQKSHTTEVRRQQLIHKWRQHTTRVEGSAIPDPVEMEVLCPDGKLRCVLINATTVYTDMSPHLTVNILYDISERKLAEERLKMSGRVFNQAHEGILITDSDGLIVDINPAFTEITGYSREEAIGQKPSMLSSGKHSQNFYKEIWSNLADKGFWQGEIWNQRKNGDLYAEQLTISTLFDEHGETRHYLGMFSDVTKSIQQQQALEMMAHYDMLTQLPNRTLFADRFQLAIAHSRRNHSLLAVVFLDLDGFKPVNDQYGHDAGDQILIQVAQRIRASIRQDDTASRLGGDEFVLLLNDVNSIDHCDKLLRRVRHAIELPFQVGDDIIHLSASLGITLYPNDNADADTLLRHADQAMYQAKVNGRGRHAYFDTKQDQQINQQQSLLQTVQYALAAGQLRLHFQPKINMCTGEIVGAEALIRWQHPEKGMIPPAQFLPMLQGSELEIQVGNWVLEQAISQVERWLALDMSIEISVNISSQHLQWPGLLDHLERVFEQHPSVPNELLQLEILESSVLSDLNMISNIIHTCRTLGIHIALDDFGTGYSSLTHLRHLPVDVVKIDRSFIADIIDDPDDFTIVDGVIGLTESFHHQVIAEGVETDTQGLMLISMGCQLAQGFGIAKPMNEQDFLQWYQNYQPNHRWMDHAQLNMTTEQTIAQLMSLQCQYWSELILENLQSDADSVSHWPLMNLRKSHFNLWLEQSRKQNLFTPDWLGSLEVAYSNLVQQANTLKQQFQSSTTSVEEEEVRSFRKQVMRIESLLSTYLL